MVAAWLASTYCSPCLERNNARCCNSTACQRRTAIEISYEWRVQRDLPWELDSRLHTMGRSSLGGTLGAPANFGSHCRVTTEADGSRRLIGSSFQEGLLSGELTFLEYDEHMRLLHRTSAQMPVQLQCLATLLYRMLCRSIARC